MSIPTQGETRIVIEMPGEDGKKKTANGQEPSATNPANEKSVKQNPASGEQNTISSQMVIATTVQVVQVGKTALNNGIGAIGTATGDYYKQAQAEQSIQTISQFGGMFQQLASKNFTGLALNVGFTIMNGAFESYNKKQEIKFANYAAEQYAKRLGYTAGRR